MVELKNYMNMSARELEAEEVGAGSLDFYMLFGDLFPEEKTTVTPGKVARLEKAYAYLCEQDEFETHGEELLEICYGKLRQSMADMSSLGGYLFNTPLDVMRMDLLNVLALVKTAYEATEA